MIGRKLFQWDAKDQAKGMSTSDDMPDAGFSPSTDQIQLTKVPGVAYAPAQATDSSTNVDAAMIASCEDPTGSYDRVYVSSSTPDGQFYSLVSGVITKRGSLDSTHQYVQGKTDMMGIFGEVYTTTNSTIVRWSSIGSSNTFDTAWATFTSSTAPHPTLRYNGFGYYGDGNLLLRQSAANVAPITILTLPAGSIIVALGIDPGSGLMLISVIGQINLSDQINSGASVIFYNGSSSTFQRQVQVDDMVTAFPATEGALYAAYGQNLGQWNGSGITFLRKMNVDFAFVQLMYKQHFTSIGSTLYMIEKHKIIAYGPIQQKGPNIFYPAFANTPSGVATNLTHIANTGQNVMSYAYISAKFFLWDVSSVATSNTIDLFTNEYEFDDEFWIYWIRVIWKTSVNNGVDPGSLRLLDQDGVVQSVNPSTSGVMDLKNTSGAGSAFKDLLNLNVRLKQVQIELISDIVNPGIRRIIVYGEMANRPKT